MGSLSVCSVLTSNSSTSSSLGGGKTRGRTHVPSIIDNMKRNMHDEANADNKGKRMAKPLEWKEK